jgi:hypothetical protein
VRILFVAMHNSIHTARWIRQLRGLGWDLHLFPIQQSDPDPDLDQLHPEIREITVHHPGGLPLSAPRPGVREAGTWPLRLRGPARKDIFRRIRRRFLRRDRDLAATVRRIRPDVVHSMEFQHAGYLTLAALPHMGPARPPWLAANWGSDVYLYGRLASDREQVRALLRSCDYYHCECERDVALAREFGLRGEVVAVSPSGGGFDVATIAGLSGGVPPSARRVIVLKGYQHWAGRALVGIRALELCADVLSGYRIVVLPVERPVAIAAELASQRTGIEFETRGGLPHEETLRLFASARVHIGLSISDAISTSFLESMITGAFPIQSCTSCASEWIDDGVGGIIVPPEDPEVIARAIRRALADDALVDEAARSNRKTAMERLDLSVVRPRVTEMYERIAAATR